MDTAMKKLMWISIIGLTMFSCGKSNVYKTQKRSKTPSHLVMSQDEKLEVNYDARENRKVIQDNLKNKEANMKAARKQREKQTEELNKLNQSGNKTKKRKNPEAFSFY